MSKFERAKKPAPSLVALGIWHAVYIDALRILRESPTRKEAIRRIKKELRPHGMEVGY